MSCGICQRKIGYPVSMFEVKPIRNGHSDECSPFGESTPTPLTDFNAQVLSRSKRMARECGTEVTATAQNQSIFFPKSSSR